MTMPALAPVLSPPSENCKGGSSARGESGEGEEGQCSQWERHPR